MRKRILAFVMILGTNASLAWGQRADDKPLPPVPIPRPEMPAVPEPVMPVPIPRPELPAIENPLPPVPTPRPELPVVQKPVVPVPTYKTELPVVQEPAPLVPIAEPERPAGHEPAEAETNGHEAGGAESRRPFSILHLFKKEEGHLPESAEEAEHHAEKPLRLWVRGEYMIWWIKSANFPPLVTTGDPADPAPGALNSLNTRILYGNSGMDFFDRKGGRFSAGWWFDDEQRIGLEAGYFFLAGRSINRTFSSEAEPGQLNTLYPIVANPFFNVNTGQPDSALVTFPGIANGRVVVDATTFFQGVEFNVSDAVVPSEKFRLEALAGFRYLNLSEGLRQDQTSAINLAPQFAPFLPPALQALDGRTITISDRFDTRNYFYGGQLGLRTELHEKRWIIGLMGKIALGASHEVVNIRGSTSIDTQPVTTSAGGVYALSTNSGQFTRNVFAVVPETGISLGFKVTEHIRASASYSFLYWSNVARPGDQIDTNLNPNFIPTSNTFGAGGTARPAFNFRSTDFFAHGVNLGLEIRY